MDDILVHARNHEEHRQRLQKVLLRLQESGLTLNAEKCQFFQTEVKFLGQIIDDKGIRPDPGKIAAIQNVSEPKCVMMFTVFRNDKSNEQIPTRSSR